MRRSFAMRFAMLTAFVASAAGTSDLPSYPATWDMARSTIIMPCNGSGFADPHFFSKFGIVDFDWSNAKAAWANAHPMDCEERLVTQAAMVKAVNPDAKVWVYRNLVKALPWYSSVREKMLDPAYAGWFLPFKPGGTNGTGTWNVPACTTGTNAGATQKCSGLYHDQQQTPNAHPRPEQPSRERDVDGWWVYNQTNDVSGMHPGWHTIVSGGPQPTWEGCRDAGTALKKKIFTFWCPADPITKHNPNLCAGGANGTCWLLDDWHTPSAQIPPYNVSSMPSGQLGHVSGYRPDPTNASDVPPPSLAQTAVLCADGDCDCGEGLPCGEYLWDHRNGSMLRDWLVSEFILNNDTGLGNANVDGFYFDDGWSNVSAPVPSWAPPTYRTCSMSPVGGPTEEDAHCAADMGLTQADTTALRAEWTATMSAVKAAVLGHGGFGWPYLASRGVFSLDLRDPRKECAAYHRQQCAPAAAGGGSASAGPLMMEFTRKAFHAPFPLPFPTQDAASFLLVRGAYAWLGFSWMGCDTEKDHVHQRPAVLDVDYGTPTDASCAETSAGSGVFAREWSKASVQLDCNTWEATIKMKA